MNIKNCICTADAINTQNRVVDAIVAQKGYYVLTLKKNQPGTYDDWLLYFNTPEFLKEIKDIPNGYYESVRKTTYHENIEWFEEKKWKDLKSVGYVVTEKTDKKTKEVTVEERYFICNIKANAYLFAMAVRNHWGVEVMHWYLDVSFEEDRTRIKNKEILENLTIINRFVLSALTLVKSKLFPKKSISGARKMIAMKFEERLTRVLKVLSYFQNL